MTSEPDMFVQYAALVVLLHIFTLTEQQMHGHQTQYKVSNTVKLRKLKHQIEWATFSLFPKLLFHLYMRISSDKNSLLIEVFYCERYV